MRSSEMCRKIQNSGLCESSLIIYFLTKLKKSPQGNFEVSTEWSNGKLIIIVPWAEMQKRQREIRLPTVHFLREKDRFTS